MINRKLFRALLIDPKALSVRVVEYDGGYETTRELVASSGLDHFRLADHGNSWDYGWCDEEALIRGGPIEAFLFSVRKDPVGGLCLLTGVDKDTGDTCDAKFDIEILRREITWLGKIIPEVTWDEPKPGHLTTIVTYARVRA